MQRLAEPHLIQRGLRATGKPSIAPKMSDLAEEALDKPEKKSGGGGSCLNSLYAHS